MARTIQGFAFLIAALVLALMGIQNQYAQPPAQESLVEVVGVATDVTESTLHRKQGEMNVIEFTVDGRRFSCANDQAGFGQVASAIRAGKTLSVDVDPKGSKALIGSMHHYYRIREGNSVLLPYETKLKEFKEGRSATLFFSLGLAAILCFPAYQLLLGRQSARALRNAS